MTYHHRNEEIADDIAIRRAVIADLFARSLSIPIGWHKHRAEASLTLTSPDRGRIIKIDSYKVYTLDVRQADGTYKSNRFPCKTVDEAWSMARQAILLYRPKNATN